MWEILRVFKKASGCKRRMLEMINASVLRCISLEGTEMHQVGYSNSWELLASFTLPPALLHVSDEQKVG
jgi:hypothetical protein